VDAELSELVAQPLHEVVALGHAHVQQQLGDLTRRSGVPLPPALILEPAVVDLAHHLLETGQRLAGDLMRGDLARHDRPGTGTGDARKDIPLGVEAEHGADEPDALDATPLEDQVDLRAIGTFDADHACPPGRMPTGTPRRTDMEHP